MPKYYDELDAVLRALADPTRRAVVERLATSPAVVSELAAPFSMALPSLMQHLRVLEEADLVIVSRKGRERWNHLNPLPIKHIHDRWIGPFAARAVDRLDRLKSELERSPKSVSGRVE